MRYTVIIVIVFSLAFSGCVQLKQPNTKFEYYTLEYNALRSDKSTDPGKKSTVLKIKHFNASPIYNTDRIIYSDQQFKRSPYFYHKWG